MNVNHVYMRYPNGLKKALTLSYDDGVFEDVRLIEIMQKHGLKGTFNINAGLFAKKESALRDKPWGNRLSREEALELYSKEGIEPAMHGYNHASLFDLPMPQATLEVVRDRECLEELFDRELRGMAYAYGTYNEDAVEILKNCGVLYCRTTISTEDFRFPTDWLRLPATCHHKNCRLPELTEKFIQKEIGIRERPALFYLWGHSYEFAKDDNWNVIEEFAERIGNREDIWYATNSEIFEYAEAYDRLRFDVGMTRAINPTSRTLWFLFGKKLYCIAPGETLPL